jgi:hypothetical protein
MRAGTWADRAEASWLSDELGGKPHVALACGHLSPPGRGPLAGAGYGYCRYHGVTRIAPGTEITSPGDAAPQRLPKAGTRSRPPRPRTPPRSTRSSCPRRPPTTPSRAPP